MATDTDKKNPIPENVPASVKADIEKARAAQATRRAAPPITATTPQDHVRDALRRTFCPESVDEYDNRGKRTKKAKFQSCFVPLKSYSKFVMDGYEPVLNDGAFVEDEGDRLVKLPRDLHDRKLQEPVIRDRARLREKSPEVKNANARQNKAAETFRVIAPGDADHAAVAAGTTDGLPAADE